MDRYRTLAAFRARISAVLSLTTTVLAVRRVQGYVTGSWSRTLLNSQFRPRDGALIGKNLEQIRKSVHSLLLYSFVGRVWVTLTQYFPLSGTCSSPMLVASGNFSEEVVAVAHSSHWSLNIVENRKGSWILIANRPPWHWMCFAYPTCWVSRLVVLQGRTLSSMFHSRVIVSTCPFRTTNCLISS